MGSRLHRLRRYLRLRWRYLGELRFDRAHGVDTRGIVGHGAHAEDVFRHAVWYQGTPLRRFRRLIGRLGIRYAEFVFVDVGCGKGRNLLLAASFPFRRIVGVELAEDLAATARRNAAAFRSRRPDAPEIEVVRANAAEYVLPDEPAVVYLYNPFDAEIMRPFLRRLEESLHARPRELVLVYYKPVLARQLDAQPFLRRERSGRDHVVYRAVSTG